MPTLLERFEDNYIPEPNSGCWLWLAGLNGDGYGYMLDDVGVLRSGHRISYELHVGPIPDGLQLDHLCRVRCCANPAHVEPVTCKVNIDRGILAEVAAAIQKSKTHCPAGHPYSKENTYVWGRGFRKCRICYRAADARRKLRNKAKRLAFGTV